jgi:large subunit ribosomal protein L21
MRASATIYDRLPVEREEISMYAVIKTGGKQHKVQPGDVIEVELMHTSGDMVTFTPLLVVDDDGSTHVGKEASKAKVTAKLVGEQKGDKVKIFKYRPKTGYAKRAGHRQMYTLIEIQDVSLGGTTSKKAASEKAEKAEPKAGKAESKADKAETAEPKAEKAEPKAEKAANTDGTETTPAKASADADAPAEQDTAVDPEDAEDEAVAETDPEDADAGTPVPDAEA